MARQIRRSRPALIDHLFARPRAFTLFQAIRLIERAGVLAARKDERELPEPVGRCSDPHRAPVTFRSHVPLAFAADEVTALISSEHGPPRLTQTVIGLTGSTGVLPHVFSDMVQASVREREFGLRAFLDVFNNRIAGLLYDAWAKHRPNIERERASLPGTRAPIDNLLAAVIGIGQPSLRQRMSVPDATPIHYSGLLGRRVRSAQAVKQVLSGALGYPIGIEQFYGTWLPIAPRDQTRLAGNDSPEDRHCGLGTEMVVGARVWDVQACVCLVVGPLAYRDFLSFLPDGLMNRYLMDLAIFALGPEYAIRARIVLLPEEVPPLRLGRDPNDIESGRLGRNTWLGWTGRRTLPGEVDFQLASPFQ